MEGGGGGVRLSLSRNTAWVDGGIEGSRFIWRMNWRELELFVVCFRSQSWGVLLASCSNLSHRYFRSFVANHYVVS